MQLSCKFWLSMKVLLKHQPLPAYIGWCNLLSVLQDLHLVACWFPETAVRLSWKGKKGCGGVKTRTITNFSPETCCEVLKMIFPVISWVGGCWWCCCYHCCRVLLLLLLFLLLLLCVCWFVALSGFCCCCCHFLVAYIL